MTRRILAFAALVATALAPAAHAQTGGLRGFVTSAQDAQPLAGATVLAQRLDAAGRPSGDPRGAAADLDGLYVLPRLPVGRYAVRVSFVGYAALRDTLTLGPGLRTFDVALALAAATLDGAVVEAGRAGGGARVTAGVQAIEPADIALIPTPDVSGDLAAYLTATPGVVSTGDRGGQLFIRGGEPTQNLVLLDGMVVYQPFHVLGFYSAFPSDLLAGADLYAGGYPARFGGQLSSVLDVQTRTGNKQRVVAAASVAPFVSAVRAEGPISRGSVSFLASARVSTVEPFASRLVRRDLPFAFSDVFGKVHATVTPNAQLAFTALRTTDRGTVGEDAGQDAVGAAPPPRIEYDNTAVGFRFLFLPGVSALRAEVLGNASELTSRLGPAGAPERATAIARFGSETHLTYYLPRAELRGGLFLRLNRLRNGVAGLGAPAAEEYFTEAGAYLEPELRPVPGVQIAGGVRLASYPNDARTVLEPRARVVLTRGPVEVSAAGGRYTQEVVGVTDRRDVASVYTAWTRAPGERVPQAWHAIAGTRVRGPGGLELVAEGYAKWLDNLAVGEWTAFPRLTTRTQPARGRAAGLDLRAELRRGPLYGYVGYGLARVEYEALGERLQLWYGEETLRYSPPHDRRHQATALVAGTLAGVNLSARVQAGSGLPFSRAVGFDRFVNPSLPSDPAQTPGLPRVIYERPYNGRLPAFFRLDVSADRSFALRRGLELTVQGALINATDRANLFYYDTFTLRRVDQLPLIPSLGIKLAAGE